MDWRNEQKSELIGFPLPKLIRGQVGSLRCYLVSVPPQFAVMHHSCFVQVAVAPGKLESCWVSEEPLPVHVQLVIVEQFGHLGSDVFQPFFPPLMSPVHLSA